MLRHIQHRKIAGDEGMNQRQTAEGGQREHGDRGITAKVSQPRCTQPARRQRQQPQQQGHRKCQVGGEMAQLNEIQRETV